MEHATTFDHVRSFCLSLPGVTERLSHGQPTFFVGEKRPFVMYVDNHHEDGRLALWCASLSGVQAALVQGAPDRYFVPPYVGARGWIGVHLDRGTSWEEIAGIIEDAYDSRAPKQRSEDSMTSR